MTLLLWCVFAACLLPYLAHLIVMWGKWNAPEGYERHLPRTQNEHLTGLAGRAWGAEQNAFESAIVFTPIALIAWFVGSDEALNGLLGVGWVVFRLGHLVAYLADLPLLRSALFSLALGCVGGLIVLAATT